MLLSPRMAAKFIAVYWRPALADMFHISSFFLSKYPSNCWLVSKQKIKVMPCYLFRYKIVYQRKILSMYEGAYILTASRMVMLNGYNIYMLNSYYVTTVYYPCFPYARYCAIHTMYNTPKHV